MGIDDTPLELAVESLASHIAMCLLNSLFAVSSSCTLALCESLIWLRSHIYTATSHYVLVMTHTGEQFHELNQTPLTSLLNLSCSERTATSYRFSIFLISCSSLNFSFVNLVFSTSIWLCERVRWSSSFLSVDMVTLAVSVSSSNCLILARNWNESNNWSFMTIFITSVKKKVVCAHRFVLFIEY